jgi:hypothetical protein
VSYGTLSFDFIGLFAYIIVAMGIGYILKQKKMDLMIYVVFGFAAPIVFNLLFSVFGFFQFDLMLSAKAGIQQAIVTGVIAKFWGVK